MKQSVAIILSIALLPFALFALFIDVAVGASASPNFVGFFIAIGVVVGALAIKLGKHKALLLAPAAFILFILALHLADTPVKRAIHAVHEIQPGMTEAEVRAVFDHYFPEDGRFKRPEIGEVENDELMFAIDLHDDRYNAALVVVEFVSGKCVSAEFLPD